MEKYIISKEEIEAFEGISKTHFLNKNAKRTNKSLGDLTGIQGFGFHIIEVQPGHDSTELHVHYFEDECVYILEGKAEATIGDDVFLVNAGDFIGYRSGGSAHTLTNTGDHVLRCIVVGERLSHDVSDYPRLNKRLYRNKSMKWSMVDLKNLTYPDAGTKT